MSSQKCAHICIRSVDFLGRTIYCLYSNSGIMDNKIFENIGVKPKQIKIENLNYYQINTL